VLVDLIGLEKLTTAYGIITLVRGISTIMGPPIAGKFSDLTNYVSNYNNYNKNNKKELLKTFRRKYKRLQV